MHAEHGNGEAIERNLVILQLNYSNCNFSTKIDELKVTVIENKADLVLISESNFNTADTEAVLYRESKLTDYKFVDKTTANNPVARLTVMVKSDLKFERMPEVEDNENPMVTLKFKEKKGKNLTVT